MRIVPAVAAAGASLAIAAQPPLRVLRVAPSKDAAPTAEITVAFDRPVAGSLDRTVDAKSLFTIAPAVSGTVEWRDPITIRFKPAAPLTSGTTYTITISDAFQAMDGSRLERPYTFSFRVLGPQILTGAPVGPYRRAEYLRPRTKFELVVSSPADFDKLAATVRLEFGDSCAVRTTIPLRPIAQRRVATKDPWDYKAQWAGGRGGWQREGKVDSLRRVVVLVPELPLPPACRGELVAPSFVDPQGTAPYTRWTFHTAGPFALVEATCSYSAICPRGPITLRFSTPVRGSDLLRHLSIMPALPLTIHDSSAEAAHWHVEAPLTPRTSYRVALDSTLTDMFGQRLQGETVRTLTTSGFATVVNYDAGQVVVERNGFRTLAIHHVNVDTLEVWMAPVPDSLTIPFVRAYPWTLNQMWTKLQENAVRRLMPVSNVQDRPMISVVRVPAYNAQRPGSPVLTAIWVSSPQFPTSESQRRSITLAQVTNLGVHGKIGEEEGEVWVTGLDDGRPREGATVTILDAKGRARTTARTDADGIARLSGYYTASDSNLTDEERYNPGFSGAVSVVLDDDRAVIPIKSFDRDLSPWRFHISAAWGSGRHPAAAAVFTERGIYRPGETVYAKAIVRRGLLGSLRAPPPNDSVRWIFTDREQGTLRDTIVAPSRFGTADQALQLPGGIPLGTYQIVVQLRLSGRWTDVSRASYRVAEYRPPEFLVDVTTPTEPRYGGDTLRATVEARYLFGAPMARTAVSWTLQQTPLDPWELTIPNTEGYFFGEGGAWWDDEGESAGEAIMPVVGASGVDTLDGAGHLDLRIALAPPGRARPTRATIQATVTDINRQSVGSAASVLVHPAAFYIGAKAEGDSYFWVAGTRRRIALIVARPDGQRVAGTAIRGVVVRREWHRIGRVRNGEAELAGEWVSDTVARCALTSSDNAAAFCDVTPPEGGLYIVTFRASDGAGREAVTRIARWASGTGFVPWYDENRLTMEVVADKARYQVGDTATILFAVPFTDAEAWVTVEREGVIAQRRMRITSGSTTLRFPITEAFAPNAFVSMLVSRSRSAPPGKPDDPGRPTIRVGYVELRVTPEAKRLAVDVQPLAPEYGPGDTARIQIRVRDARGAGQRSEVALWATDEGVLALTGFQTPDPIDLIYQARGLGLHLASNVVSVAAQLLAQEGITIKGDQSPGGGGGRDASGVLRSRFRPTAFFLGSVMTDPDGRATATAKLPDNLTTFRVMAVAVTTEDRYGKGQAPLLVTRPLLARPALPRFLRRDDDFTAGVVVNQRAGGTATARVEAAATGVVMREPRVNTITIAAGRGTETRFAFRDTTSDTAVFRFTVSDGRNTDAVETRLPVKPAYHVRAHTVAGVLRDTAIATFVLPGDIDPARSRLGLSFGTSALAVIRAAYRWLRVYPYDCTEQVVSEALPLIALVRARQAGFAELQVPRDSREQIQTAVATILRRQRIDGGIGLWSASDWTTPWLSAYAGSALLEARAAGIAVSDSALGRLADYVRTKLHTPGVIHAPVAWWYSELQARLSEQVAAVDFLSRLGGPDAAGENDLLRLAPQLAWEDRVRLAEVLARRGATGAARGLLEAAWAQVRVEGRRAVLPSDAVRSFYFYSRVRPAAALLTATLAVDSAHALIGPLVETLVQQGRAGALSVWNTQDFGAVLSALAAFDSRQKRAAARGVRVTAAGRTLFESGVAATRDSSLALTGLLQAGAAGATSLSVRLAAAQPGAAVYYYLTVQEVPLARPVTPDDAGIAVERWYEDYGTGKPITRVAEGGLVRVRLRITIPADRQFVVMDDPLPAGLEAVDLSLRTIGALPGPGAAPAPQEELTREAGPEEAETPFDWSYGSWDAGWWSPFDHRELRDDRVVYVATVLWKGSYTATYVARATTPGVFVLPPVHTEEMYNPATHGRSSGGVFTVTAKTP
jgi:alpha-2-macroglobulin